MAEIIECTRCGRRHPTGTEWCPCGVYLPHDGKIIEGELDAPGSSDESPTADTTEETVGGARVAVVPDASFEPGPDDEAVEPQIDDGMEPTLAAEAMVASGGFVNPVQQAYEPTFEVDVQTDTGFDDHVPRPDDQICPDDTCHTRNPAGLVFCRRCGTELLQPTDEEIQARFSWWQRLKARLTGRDLRQSAMQAKYQVRRVKGLSTRARMFRTAALGGALGAAGLGLSPSIRGQVMDRVKDVTFADRYSFVAVESVSTSSPIEAGWEPELILDGTFNRAWGTTWPFDGAGIDSLVTGLDCLPPAGPDQPDFPELRFVLTEAATVDRLRIWSGTWEADEGRELRPRPLVLEIRPTLENGDQGTCLYVELEDQPEEQAIELDLPKAAAIDVRVVGVIQGEDNSRNLAISELWFEVER